MIYEEAKPFLKEGMKIKVEGSTYQITEFDWQKLSGLSPMCLKDESGYALWRHGNGIEKKAIEILSNPDGTPWIHPQERAPVHPKFKVGDRVRITSNTGCTRHVVSSTATIKGVNDLGNLTSEDGCGLVPDWIEKIDDEPTLKQIVYGGARAAGKNNLIKRWVKQINEPQAQKETTQMSVVKMIKAKFSPTDKTLVKHGYLTDKGERTSMYEEELKDAAIADLIEAQDTAAFRKELASALSDEE